MPDPFQHFAEECGLCMTAECLSAAPRDVLTPVPQAEQHFLVTLTRQNVDAAPVRVIFITPLTEPKPPQIRDVLWWVTGDAWVLEQGQRDLGTWAASLGYPADAEPTARLFEHHVRQADALAALLSEAGYQRLLSLYDSRVAPLEVGRSPVVR